MVVMKSFVLILSFVIQHLPELFKLLPYMLLPIIMLLLPMLNIPLYPIPLAVSTILIPILPIMIKRGREEINLLIYPQPTPMRAMRTVLRNTLSYPMRYKFTNLRSSYCCYFCCCLIILVIFICDRFGDLQNKVTVVLTVITIILS